MSAEELAGAGLLSFTDSVDDIADCSVFIVTVPTPIDKYKTPDLTPLIKANESVGQVLMTGDIVIYESTVYPGDKERRVTTIKKVTFGSTPAIAEEVDALYADVITAGSHKASFIKVAEAAKVIENTQRDLNIALMNELAMIFSRLGIDTHEVLAAAGTKWNFLPFKPGPVGGHCIGVDPYYLTHKAQAIGYHPDIILAGRRVNDGMGPYVAS